MAANIPAGTIRPAKSADEAKALWWPLMKELGWNRAETDAHVHFNVTQATRSWLLLFPDSASKPEGCVVAFTYPNSTGWVGFFIMNATFRGKGFGRELWREMELVFRNAGTSVIGLDGVEEQVETYKRRGFVDCARIPLMTRKSPTAKPIDITWESDDTLEIQELREVNPHLVAKLDYDHTGLDRSAYWAFDALIANGSGYAAVRNGKVTGLVYERSCEHGKRIGPLYAATYGEARQLLHTIMTNLSDVEGSFIAETFGSNPDGRRIFEDLGWDYAGLDYHRMWLDGKVPAEQQEGGKGVRDMYAIFDAGAG